MKLKLPFIALFLTGFLGFAQLPNNSTAPNFTATDINGNTHTLQDYLDDGKTVILNFSATWCGPCWNYKETGALKDIYYAFGEHGSDEVVVLYIEGDPNTGLNELYGISGNTIGDWVSSTPFPIISNAALANQYQIGYWPTLYRICPDGIVNEINQLSNSNLESSINANCGVLSGVNNHAHVKVEDTKMCDEGDATDAIISLTNYGNNAINTLNIDVSVNGNIQSYTENVSLSKFQQTSFTINHIFVEGNANEFEIVSINGTSPFNSVLNTSNPEFSIPDMVGEEVEVHIYTDNYPSEISWNMKDDSGNLVASGGPYQPGNADQWGGGGPDAHTTKIHSVTLPTQGACYSIELLDAFGDGWGFSNGNVDPGVAIFYDSELIFSETSVGNFGSSLELNNAIKYNEPLSVDVFETFNFSMYPNPSNGVLNLSANQNFEFEIYTLQGKKVYQQKAASNMYTTELYSLQKGIYLVKLNISGVMKTQKLIIN